MIASLCLPPPLYFVAPLLSEFVFCWVRAWIDLVVCKEKKLQVSNRLAKHSIPALVVFTALLPLPFISHACFAVTLLPGRTPLTSLSLFNPGSYCIRLHSV
jgi:hypothetical protein